jgi:hypothetical protein
MQKTSKEREHAMEQTMKYRLILPSIVALSVIAAAPALARVKHKAQSHCMDKPQVFSWSFLLPGQPEPQPNGCAPPVYAYGNYIGLDPDPNIRFQLLRDPATGYSAHQNN